MPLGFVRRLQETAGELATCRQRSSQGGPATSIKPDDVVLAAVQQLLQQQGHWQQQGSARHWHLDPIQ